MYSFINLKKPKNTITGITDEVYIALLDWFEPNGIKQPGMWVEYGDEVLIKNTHTFLPGKGFLKFSLTPNKNEYNAQCIGDLGFLKFANEVKALLPGTYATLHETLYLLTGKAAIVLVKDADCASRMYYQIGTENIAARIAASFSTGNTKDGNKGYVLSITNTAEKVFLYAGEITFQGENSALIARLVGQKNGNIITLDASTSSILSNTTFEYVVMYNDVQDSPQEIILPDTANSAAFNLNILTNWNNAGFAVKLTAIDGVITDTTLSSDIDPEKPFIQGGFDEGFDTGFDFNI